MNNAGMCVQLIWLKSSKEYKKLGVVQQASPNYN